MTKRFIPQVGSNNTIKLYDAVSGQLYRVINVDGNIISQPICLDNEMYVTVKQGSTSVIKYYNLPTGNLKKIQPI